MRLDLFDLSPELFARMGEFIGRLQIHPKLGSRAEETRKAHRHVRADACFLQGDITYALRIYTNGFGQCIPREVGDCDFVRISIFPDETNTELVIDANSVLSAAISG
jgi:hypothetical protein